MAEGNNQLFEKPLSEMSDEELIARAQSLRTERKYPTVTKAKAKRGDAVSKLIDSFVVKDNLAKK